MGIETVDAPFYPKIEEIRRDFILKFLLETSKRPHRGSLTFGYGFFGYAEIYRSFPRSEEISGGNRRFCPVRRTFVRRGAKTAVEKAVLILK